MMEYVYFYDGNFYTVIAGCPVVADRLFNRLARSHTAAAEATITSIKHAA